MASPGLYPSHLKNQVPFGSSLNLSRSAWQYKSQAHKVGKAISRMAVAVHAGKGVLRTNIEVKADNGGQLGNTLLENLWKKQLLPLCLPHPPLQSQF